MKYGTHYEFDDERHWRFSRNSGLPRGYFDKKRLNVDALVVAVSVVSFLVGVCVAF